jgi:hypothetical protein
MRELPMNVVFSHVKIKFKSIWPDFDLLDQERENPPPDL